MRYLIASRVSVVANSAVIAELTKDELTRLRKSMRDTGRDGWFVITPLDEAPVINGLAAVKATLYERS